MDDIEVIDTKTTKKQSYNKKYYEKKKNKKLNISNSDNEKNIKIRKNLINEGKINNMEKKDEHNKTKLILSRENEQNMGKLSSEFQDENNTIELNSDYEKESDSIELNSDYENETKTIESSLDCEDETKICDSETKNKYINTIIDFYKNDNYTKKITKLNYDIENNILNKSLTDIINVQKNNTNFKITYICLINEIIYFLKIIETTTENNPFVLNYINNNIVIFFKNNVIVIIVDNILIKEIIELINNNRIIIKMLSKYKIMIMDENNSYLIEHHMFNKNYNMNIINYKNKIIDNININDNIFDEEHFKNLIINTLNNNNNKILTIYLEDGEIYYYKTNDTIFINNNNAIKNKNLLNVFGLLIKNNNYTIQYTTNNYHCSIQKKEINNNNNKLNSTSIKTYEDKIRQLENANIIIDENMKIDKIEEILKTKYKNNTVHLFLNAILYKIKNNSKIPENTITKLREKIKSYCEINTQERGENKKENIIKWEEVLNIHTQLKNNLKSYKDILNYTLLSVYIYIPPRRLDYNNVLITDAIENCNDINKNYYLITTQQFIFCNYKTSIIKSNNDNNYKHIEQIFNIPPILIEILNNYINYPGKEKKINDYLFSYKNNNKINMSKRACYNKLRKILGNRPVQSARSSFVTFKHDINKTTNEIMKDSDMMSHKLGTHLTYSKHN